MIAAGETMVYFEYVLQSMGARGVASVAAVRTGDEPAWLFPDLLPELATALPRAAVRVCAPKEVGPVDLAVVALTGEFAFPLEDVLYRDLERLRGLEPHLRCASWVLLLRVRWREAELLSGAALRRHLLGKRLQRRLVGLLASPRLRRGPLRPAV